MLSYSYVKTYLLPDRSKTTKKKTSVKKGVDPIFNETIKVVTIITSVDLYQKISHDVTTIIVSNQTSRAVQTHPQGGCVA